MHHASCYVGAPLKMALLPVSGVDEGRYEAAAIEYAMRRTQAGAAGSHVVLTLSGTVAIVL